jgi:hypoxanthine phosphoribosyltransferase
METKVTVNGLTFVPYIKREQINKEIKRLASQLREDLKGTDPVFLCVLSGAFVFAADLYRELDLNDSKISFIKYSSYQGTSSTGKVKQLVGLTEDIEGKDVVIIEDIVDTGLTAVKMIDDLKAKNPRSVKFVTLLHKPESSVTGFVPDYVAFSIPPKFIIGYGLDLDGKARNLKDIYVIDEESEESANHF